MKTSTLAFGAAALLAALAAPAPASAQAVPGLYTLPKGDFIWRWGNQRHEREIGDFEVRGNDQGFQCELIGEVSPTSSLTPSEVRDLEASLQGRIDFAYAATTAMRDLEFRRELDWAVLTCEKGAQGSGESTPEEKAENEARAREKMQREIERRRERAQRDANN